MNDITIQIAKANFALDNQYRNQTTPIDKFKTSATRNILISISDILDPDGDFSEYCCDTLGIDPITTTDDIYKLQNEIIISVRDILTACVNSNNQ